MQKAIKSIDDVNIDVDQRWTLAIGFSNLVCSMIHVADGMYGKLVNGIVLANFVLIEHGFSKIHYGQI